MLGTHTGESHGPNMGLKPEGRWRADGVQKPWTTREAPSAGGPATGFQRLAPHQLRWSAQSHRVPRRKCCLAHGGACSGAEGWGSARLEGASERKSGDGTRTGPRHWRGPHTFLTRPFRGPGPHRTERPAGTPASPRTAEGLSGRHTCVEGGGSEAPDLARIPTFLGPCAGSGRSCDGNLRPERRSGQWPPLSRHEAGEGGCPQSLPPSAAGAASPSWVAHPQGTSSACQRPSGRTTSKQRLSRKSGAHGASEAAGRRLGQGGQRQEGRRVRGPWWEL